MKYILCIVVIILCSCSQKFIVPIKVVKENIPEEDSLFQFDREELTLDSKEVTIVESEFIKPSTNGVKWLSVLTEDENPIEVKINHTSTFKIIGNNGKIVKMLVMTTYIKNGYLYGNRSLLIGLPRKIKLDNIKTIELFSENTKKRGLISSSENIKKPNP